MTSRNKPERWHPRVCPKCGGLLGSPRRLTRSNKAMSHPTDRLPAGAMRMDDNHRIDRPHNANGFNQDAMEKVANAAGVKAQNTKNVFVTNTCSKDHQCQNAEDLITR